MKKQKTLYAVYCCEMVRIGMPKKYVGGGPVALFKKKQNAEEYLQFVNDGAFPGYYYEIHEITTDL